MSGRFIVLEGPDGSGTSTHTQLLAERLGAGVLPTKEPTDGPVGAFIRTQLQQKGIPGDALQLLYCADRAWHVQHTIQPALKKGTIVVSDRYALSTRVYAEALGLDADWFEELNKKFIQPDLQLILLPSFEVCMERLNMRKTKDILEEDSLQRRVYDGYKTYAEKNHIPIIDTAVSIEETVKAIDALILH